MPAGAAAASRGRHSGGDGFRRATCRSGMRFASSHSPYGRRFAKSFLSSSSGTRQPALEVDEEHAAGLETPLGLDVGGIDRHDADLARHDHAIVVRQVVAARPQAVAIEHGADALAVRERDRRRAVPRLHEARVILVERALVLGHELVLLPRLGNHHHHGFLQRAARHQQELEDVVEHAGIRAVGLGDGEQLLQVVAEQRARDDALRARASSSRCRAAC